MGTVGGLASLVFNESNGFLAAGLLWGSLLLCCPCPVCALGSASCAAKGVALKFGK